LAQAGGPSQRLELIQPALSKMMRAATRSLKLLPRMSPAVPGTAHRFAAPVTTQLSRTFAAAAEPVKPKHQDQTLEGRYATALFMASAGRFEKVYDDLVQLRTLMQESKDFKMLILTPGIQPDVKISTLEAVCKKMGTDAAVINFLKVLIDNRRLQKLPKMVDLYESIYRAEKGLVLCKVASAVELSKAQQSDVKKAMEKRAAKGSTLQMEFSVNPMLIGGLVVRMGEAVLDNSVQSRLERLQTQLLSPVTS